MSRTGFANLAQIAELDEAIDVRSPAEFAEDHLPDAINCPVLDDEERARIGTLYVQDSPFVAKRIGAVLVARNIADHIERRFSDKPRHWRPLVYCWRGGQRSGALTHILRQIGWDARRLEGGYKTWRRHVVAQLGALPQTFSWRVIGGTTGSGKSRVIEALAAQGAQVLHLERIAAHKGSVLGNLPGDVQPSQKMFESRLFCALRAFDPARPVFVEAESRRIGVLQLPDALLSMIRSSPCLRIEADIAARVDYLLRDYDYFLADPRWLIERLEQLRGLQSNETIDRWVRRVEAGDFPTLVAELLERHYDPLYRRSQDRGRTGAVPIHVAQDLSEKGIASIAAEIIEAMGNDSQASAVRSMQG